MSALTRDEVIRMAREAGGFVGALGSASLQSVPALEKFADLVADAERIKHQAEIQRLTTLANTAEKWRGIAMARDGDGRTVQHVQDEARDAEREACAKLAASHSSEPWKHDPAAVHVCDMVSTSISAAIRARGQKGGA